jgi:hypothetical protein
VLAIVVSNRIVRLPVAIHRMVPSRTGAHEIGPGPDAGGYGRPRAPACPDPEWTASPREALDVMIALNDRCAVDGRDPNSYSSIGWVLGRYDRPWAPERPVFGTIRYMSSANAARKLRSRRISAASVPLDTAWQPVKSFRPKGHSHDCALSMPERLRGAGCMCRVVRSLVVVRAE